MIIAKFEALATDNTAALTIKIDEQPEGFHVQVCDKRDHDKVTPSFHSELNDALLVAKTAILGRLCGFDD